ncbi:nitric-oxide reductase large subunit [Novilysobacter defluvii]|uniref:Nitric oxide reductase large subunit n=1 Tax=Lysobacter defluvii IMMIB APB-9 = DSM 18482 TaxID=1385515 RepID=A0A0A0M9N0_9GAMM|nr:nitric-oxide reductase large subunit [Lysobacter defluvii]KGO99758.1 Nitric oxide reductase large subunit [Lysobacter defluvii IMMIB APB-9 = DSM 18482]
MDTTRRLWMGLGALLIVSFGIMLWIGRDIYQTAPPIPEQVVTESGRVVYTREDIETGRQVWQSIGGHHNGSIWGHGALLAPDWSAEWLHRELVAILDMRAREQFGMAYAELDEGEKARLEAQLRPRFRANTYDPATGTITITDERAAAIDTVAAHYMSVFSDDPATADLREAYALRENPVPEAEHRRQMTAFFFWASWATGTERGDDTGLTYTHNFPHEPLIGNTPSASSFMWSMFSILFMIAGIGLLGWHYAVWHGREPKVEPPLQDPSLSIVVTPSMRAIGKYFWLVMALFLTQILLGATTAHYQVEGQEAYGFALAEILPYALTRTWHTQLAILWIAVAWLATGLYLAPAMSGHEPKFQRAGVNFLFACLIIIVVGAFAGQWFAVMQKLGLAHNFWFGHQGWEYTDIGRFWQIFLFIGLLLWLVLMGRALWPALRRKSEITSIAGLFFLSTVAIALLFGAGLMWRESTHISIITYWRFWIVHLWVEGFFEVFAVAVISFIFVRLGLVRGKSATINVLFATIVFMAGGVLGMFHHLYFAGVTTGIIALGASISALEVVPLALIGLEAYDTWKNGRATPWMARYKWPILFFIAVSFWNLVGAGLLGFLINTPLALFYMQGTNLTAAHGHTALFGVYGMLGIGLMLYCLRGMRPERRWLNGLLSGAFWSFNIGLALMTVLTLLPMGVLQLEANLTHGYWYARSAEFMTRPIIDVLVWLRVPGDTVLAIGAFLVALFVISLWLGPRPVSEASRQQRELARIRGQEAG